MLRFIKHSLRIDHLALVYLSIICGCNEVKSCFRSLWFSGQLGRMSFKLNSFNINVKIKLNKNTHSVGGSRCPGSPGIALGLQNLPDCSAFG